MPEFILNHNPPSRTASHFSARERAGQLASLGPFEMGYIEAMFFTGGDDGGESEDSLNALGTGRLTLGAIAKVRDDCQRFCSTLLPAGIEHDGKTLICSIQEALCYFADDFPGILERAGRDLWFTRNGHGVGFWSRDDDDYPPSLRDFMDETAKGFGETSFYARRGWIYST